MEMLYCLNLMFKIMIKITNKKIKSADGHLLPYLEYQPDKNLITKSIILVYEIFGLTSHIKLSLIHI